MHICEIFTIEGIDYMKIISAIRNEGFVDFEDCLQEECAVYVHADYIITRNVKDFTTARVKAILPQNFIELYN